MEGRDILEVTTVFVFCTVITLFLNTGFNVCPASLCWYQVWYNSGGFVFRTKMTVFCVVTSCSGATTQKTAIFVLTAVRTSKPTWSSVVSWCRVSSPGFLQPAPPAGVFIQFLSQIFLIFFTSFVNSLVLCYLLIFPFSCYNYVTAFLYEREWWAMLLFSFAAVTSWCWHFQIIMSSVWRQIPGNFPWGSRY
jgi:hypothetical protein